MQINSKNAEYNFGVDLLKIVSMYMIVIIHILNKGGAASAINVRGGQIMSLLYIIVYSAVDSFALISGYVGFSEHEKPHRYKKLILLWFEVVFYGVMVTTVFRIFGKFEVGISDFCSAMLPVTRNQYWYFTAYICVFVFMPWVNRLIRTINLKMAKCLFVTILLVFSVYGTVAWGVGSDPFYLNNGYSFVWLLSLYIIGAIIKKHKLAKTKEPSFSKLICLWISSLGFTWFYENISRIVTRQVIGMEYGTLVLRTFLSPTILIMSISMFFLFCRLSVNNKIKGLIRFITPSVFSVYLLHTQPLIYENILNQAFAYLGEKNIVEVVAIILFSALAIFIICILIDKIRVVIFSALNAVEGADRLDNWIREKFKVLVRWIEM